MLRLDETKIEGMTKETANAMKDMPKEIKEANCIFNAIS